MLPATRSLLLGLTLALAVPAAAAAAPATVTYDAGTNVISVVGTPGGGSLTIARSGGDYTLTGTMDKAAGGGCSLAASTVTCPTPGLVSAFDISLPTTGPGAGVSITFTGDITAGPAPTTAVLSDRADFLNATELTHSVVVHGGGALDVLKTGSGDDQLDGGDDSDQLSDGPGSDTVNGGPGQDVFIASDAPDGADLYDGGGFTPTPGNPWSGDLLSYVARTVPVIAHLPEPGGTSSGNGAAGENDTLVGIGGLVGGGAPNTLTGSSAGDYLVGGESADTISGLAGDDVIAGRFGADTLLGGAGADSIDAQRTPMDPSGDDIDALIDCGADPERSILIDSYDPAPISCSTEPDAPAVPAPVPGPPPTSNDGAPSPAELYTQYFGRPADTTGLALFKAHPDLPGQLSTITTQAQAQLGTAAIVPIANLSTLFSGHLVSYPNGLPPQSPMTIGVYADHLLPLLFLSGSHTGDSASVSLPFILLAGNVANQSNRRRRPPRAKRAAVEPAPSALKLVHVKLAPRKLKPTVSGLVPLTVKFTPKQLATARAMVKPRLIMKIAVTTKRKGKKPKVKTVTKTFPLIGQPAK